MRTALVQRAALGTWEMADNIEDWHLLSSPLEGRVHSMYVDIKGLVTCGVGNLIDSIQQACTLPWKIEFGHGRLATRAEIAAAWTDIKQNRDTLSRLHWKYAAKRNELRLTDEDIDHLVESKLAEFEAYMTKHHFPTFPDWPADAQLAGCSMSWACGPAFARKFTNFKRFANEHKWLLAKACCKISETNNAGIIPRNKHNYLCFDNAAVVEDFGMDLEELHWPEKVRLSEPPEPVFPPDFVPEPELIPLELPPDWHASLEEMRKQENLEHYDR
jgi:hypothetical protein